MLLVAGLGITASLIGGRFRFRWSWTDLAVVSLGFLVGLSSVQGMERRLAINLAGSGRVWALPTFLAEPAARRRRVDGAGRRARGDGGCRLGLRALPGPG